MEERNQDELNEEYEKICFLCRRPESQTGKMIDMGGQFCICQDCMQKTIDAMQSSGISYQDMLNMSTPVIQDDEGGDEEEKGKKETKIPNISMINLSDILGGMGIPRQQVKKKKPKEKQPEKAFDVKAIPAPHKIKASLDEYVVG